MLQYLKQIFHSVNKRQDYAHFLSSRLANHLHVQLESLLTSSLFPLLQPFLFPVRGSKALEGSDRVGSLPSGSHSAGLWILDIDLPHLLSTPSTPVCGSKFKHGVDRAGMLHAELSDLELQYLEQQLSCPFQSLQVLVCGSEVIHSDNRVGVLFAKHFQARAKYPDVQDLCLSPTPLAAITLY